MNIPTFYPVQSAFFVEGVSYERPWPAERVSLECSAFEIEYSLSHIDLSFIDPTIVSETNKEVQICWTIR